MIGNVWEWVEDNWHDSYNGAPTDGSAWLSGQLFPRGPWRRLVQQTAVRAVGRPRQERA
jgi:formylglycine-generating enzyme required for sulfatase activity